MSDPRNANPAADNSQANRPGASQPPVEAGRDAGTPSPRPPGRSPAPAELPPRTLHASEEGLLDQVGVKEERKLRARSQRHRSVWFGLGMFGLVGWSVAVPAVAAIALGVWIDTRYPSQYSWTLMLLVVGVVIGCANAWYWVTREREKL